MPLPAPQLLPPQNVAALRLRNRSPPNYHGPGSSIVVFNCSIQELLEIARKLRDALQQRSNSSFQKLLKVLERTTLWKLINVTGLNSWMEEFYRRTIYTICSRKLRTYCPNNTLLSFLVQHHPSPQSELHHVYFAANPISRIFISGRDHSGSDGKILPGYQQFTTFTGNSLSNSRFRAESSVDVEFDLRGIAYGSIQDHIKALTGGMSCQTAQWHNILCHKVAALSLESSNQQPDDTSITETSLNTFSEYALPHELYSLENDIIGWGTEGKCRSCLAGRCNDNECSTEQTMILPWKYDISLCDVAQYQHRHVDSFHDSGFASGSSLGGFGSDDTSNFFSLPTLTQQHNDNRNNEGLNEFNESGHFPLSDCATSLDSLTPTQTGSRKYSHRQSTRGSKGCQSFCGTSCTPSGNFGQGPDPGSYKCDEGNGNDDSGSGGGGNGDDGDAAYDPKHPDSHGSLVECPWRHCDYSIEDKNRLKEHLKRSHLKGLQCPQSGCQHTYGDHGLIKRHLKSNVHGIASDSISDKPGRPQTLSELKHIQQKLLFEDGCFDSPYMAIICQADSPADLLKKGNLKRLVEEAQRSWDKLTNSTVQDALEHFRKLPDTSNRDAQAVGVIKSLLLKEYVDQGTDERSFEDWSQYILKLTYDYIAPPAALSWRHNDLSEVLAARETQNSERPIANDSGLGSSGSPGGIDPIPEFPPVSPPPFSEEAHSYNNLPSKDQSSHQRSDLRSRQSIGQQFNQQSKPQFSPPSFISTRSPLQIDEIEDTPMSDPPFSVADNMNATDNDFAEFESADDWEGYIDWDNQLVNTTFSPSENQQ